jgi:hypothetical protein
MARRTAAPGENLETRLVMGITAEGGFDIIGVLDLVASPCPWTAVRLFATQAPLWYHRNLPH